VFPVNIVLVQFQQTHYGVRTHSVNQFTLSPENYRADGRERERENETERMRERMRERERERGTLVLSFLTNFTFIAKERHHPAA